MMVNFILVEKVNKFPNPLSNRLLGMCINLNSSQVLTDLLDATSPAARLHTT
jgi:hypothetical protein